MSKKDRLMIGGVAALGVVIAHACAYLLVETDPHERLGLMERTGHRWWTIVAAAAIGLGALGVTALADGWRRGGGYASFDRSRVARWLIVFQMAGFVGLEAVERWASGGSVKMVIFEAPVILGLALQVGFALLEVVLLTLIAAGVNYLVRRPHVAAPTRPVVIRFEVGQPSPSPGVASGGSTLRGPPLPA